MDDADLLLHLGVTAAALDPAPERLRPADAEHRIGLPCAACGLPGYATRIVRLVDGCRWLDTCREHMIASATFQAARRPRGDILTDLREAAAEAGVALTVVIYDEAG
ncbi:hypothetical protein AB0F46_18705 [Streptomyces sp. NPDC026665]|uniref:hypothetical protein n=1 Tax=Streptomyces sp. NPDC026665 TaxID=3154798 RepID=UPI0033D6C51D